MALSPPDPAAAAKQKQVELDAVEDQWSVKLAQIKGIVDSGVFTPQQTQEETLGILAQQHDALQEVEDRWRGCGSTAPVQQIPISLIASLSGKAAASGLTLTPKTVKKGGKRKYLEPSWLRG